MKTKIGYITLAEDPLKESILSIRKDIKKIVGDDPYFSQWPPHITLSYGNMLLDEEIKKVENDLRVAASSHGEIVFSFKQEFFAFKTQSEENKKSRYTITLNTESNIDLDNLSKEIVSIAENYNDVPGKVFKSLEKKEFHLTIFSSSSITEEQFTEIKKVSKNWEVPKGGIIGSLSLVLNGKDMDGYPVMNSEYMRFNLTSGISD